MGRWPLAALVKLFEIAMEMRNTNRNPPSPMTPGLAR